jgi:WD40 repeat protein
VFCWLALLTRQNGSRLVAAISDKGIHVWSAATGKLLGKHGINDKVDTKLGHYSWNDGRLLVPSIDEEGSSIGQWELNINDARTLSGHSGYVYPVAITSDGSVIVSGGWDKTVRIWEFPRSISHHYSTKKAQTNYPTDYQNERCSHRIAFTNDHATESPPCSPTSQTSVYRHSESLLLTDRSCGHGGGLCPLPTKCPEENGQSRGLLHAQSGAYQQF